MDRITEIVIATHNPGKLREIADLLRPLGITVSSPADYQLPEPEETETTFAGNALLKARAAARATQRPSLADDSGLCVAALAGAPGVHSARWAGPDKDFGQAMKKIHASLDAANATDHSAHFICALALVLPDGTERVFEGRVDGHLVWPPRGEKGFGYDPIFIPAGHAETFAEMEPDAKHAISHRAKAFQLLKKRLA